ncbi:ABC transporter permease [Lawsonibacter sp. OA9]|uniref:ABC transporter permease n=1 Tax=Oscillospiraceae TaxID=216572 RepID=UPI001F05333A|nr:ABC transporter permease [Lawsonibacter sp. OA9]MCH1978295.1 ABC transporter permease [Lawsonibacter sp. OA9]MCH1981439.1 ABC transporter permease [Ruminococcus sp. OA3]
MKGDKKQFIGKLINEYLLLVAIIILTVYTIIVQPAFLNSGNLLSLVRSFVPLAFVSIGMTLIVIGGYIDLSVAGLFSMMSILASMLSNRFGPVSLLLILLAGLLCGAVSALILIICGARNSSDALFITFGMQTVFNALALLLNGGLAVTLEQTPFTRFLGAGNFLGIPMVLLLFIIAVVILQFLMKKMPVGRSVHLVGGNPTAAELCGIKPSKVILLSFSVTGAMTALGAYLLLCRVGTAIPTVGKNYETNAILAVCIGGTSLSGGKGSVLNTVLGVMLVTIMSNALNILGIDANMQSVWKGVILILAIWIDSRRKV